MKVGDKVIRCTCCSTSYGDHKIPPTEGEVIWIHPEGRFYRVRFEAPDGGSWVTCFPCEKEKKGQTI